MKQAIMMLLAVQTLFPILLCPQLCAEADGGQLSSAQIKHLDRMKRLCNKDSYSQQATRQMMNNLLCGSDLNTTISETRLELDVLLNSTKPEYAEVMADHVKQAKESLNDFQKTPYFLTSAQNVTMMLTCVYYDSGAFQIEGTSKFQVLWSRFANHLLSLSSYADAMLPAYEDLYYAKH